MRDQEIIGLWEAYQHVHSQPEEVDYVDEAMSSYDRNRKRAAQRAAARNEARRQGKTGAVPGVGYVTPRMERETWTDESGRERHTSGARMPNKGDQKESFELFDYLLEYLVAEGYADTNKAALAIMANMSEEWRQSICEAYKKLPVGKMIDKMRARSYSLGKSDIQQVGRPDSGNIRSGKEDERSDKMKDVLVNHKKKTSVRKSDANRRAGGMPSAN